MAKNLRWKCSYAILDPGAAWLGAYCAKWREVWNRLPGFGHGDLLDISVVFVSGGLEDSVDTALRDKIAFLISNMEGHLTTGFFRICPGHFYDSLFFPLGDGIPKLAGSMRLRSQAFISFLLIAFIPFIEGGEFVSQIGPSPQLSGWSPFFQTVSTSYSG